MATTRTRGYGRQRASASAPYQVLRSGPYQRVLTTNDPLDDDPADLMDLINGYIPDPVDGSGVYARPGMVLANGGTQLGTSGHRNGQGLYTHTDLNGDTFNFCVVGGLLYRADDTFGTLTDVTPSGITIDSTRATRLYFASLTGTLVVTDGVNNPWVASDLSNTPITGTTIQFNAGDTAWNTIGRPAVYGGALFFIINSVAGTFAQTSIAWCEPGDPTTGYLQTNFSNYWTLEQTGTPNVGATPLKGLLGTNVALFYWRENSIGSIQGVVGPDLQSTATHDSIAINIGTVASDTINPFGDTIYFADQLGRAWKFSLGNAPQDIWKQMRAIVDASNIGFPGVTAQTATAAIESTLNLYLLASWSPIPSAVASPVELYAFEANTGTYFGRWTVANGCSIDCLGTWLDAAGREVLVIIGSELPGGESGYVRTLSSVSGVPDKLTTEGGSRLTTEGGGVLETEGQQAQWMDDAVTPDFTATTNRFGYSDDTVWNADMVTILAGTTSPIAVSVNSTANANTLAGTPLPLPSQDDTYRLLCGLDGIQGRGITVQASPTDASAQRILQSIAVRAVPSLAGPDEP